VPDELVQAEIDALRSSIAELVPADDRPAQEGDTVVVDLAGADGTGQSDTVVELGSGRLVPEIESALIGASVGDTRKVRYDLADERETTVDVTLKHVNEKVLAEADDELARSASEFDTLAELRDDLREKIHELKERESVGILRDRVLDALVARTPVDLPESLIDHETEHRVAEATARAERSGLTLQQVLESQGWDEERFRSDARDHAVRAITSDLILEAVARAEDLEVTADEIGAEINALAQAYQRDAKELAKQLDRSGQIVTLASDIIRTKALDLLVEHADIQTEAPTTDGEGEQAAEAETPPEPERPEESA
jgi:trigger factor